MKPIMRKKLSTALVMALGTGVLGVTSAFAQQATRVEKIEVTGSNIKRVDAESAAPIQIIGREEIENSGKLTVGEYLQTLTVDSQGSVPPSFGSGFAPGSVGISLRGLGASSTLVLLNGRRIAPYGLADDGQKVFTDLSTIPMNAVERIEILKDGASAIYGSDAIAGVVNVILRKDYRGVTAQASVGTSRYSDADQQKASLLVGFGDLNKDRYNAFVNVDYAKSDKLQYTERLGRRDHIGAGDLRPYGYDLTAGQFVGGYIFPGGGNAASSLSGSVRNPATGLYEGLPGCNTFQPVITPADPEGGCLFNAAQFRSLMPQTKTWNLFGRGTFAITNTLEGYAEVSYSKRETEFDNTPTGVSGSWGFPGGPVNASSGPGATVLAATHPDNPLHVAGVRPRVFLWDLGGRKSNTDNEAKRFSVGFKGAAAGWDFDTAYVYSETELENRRRGFVRYSQLLEALGNPASPLFPLRIGVNANLNTQAQRDAISPLIKSEASSKLQVLDFKASRELMNLAGGPMGLAGGLEFRREETSLTPTTYTDLGDIVGLGYSAYSGRKNVVALYGELLAPVTSMIELSGAVRHDHYSVGENSTTPKLGIKITPTRQLALRGTYAEGFRQPNAAESGVGGLAAFTTTRDPVRCPGGTPAAGANSGDCARSVAIITTPDPSLKPEKSKNYSVGFVFEPFQSTSVSVDFWQIKRTDEINQTSVAAALAANTAVVRSDDNLPGRPGTGTLLAVSAPYVNSNTSKVEGVDLDLRHRINLGAGGRLTFETRWTRLNKFQRTESDGTTFEWAGTHGNCDVTNCVGTPKDRINVVLTYDAGPLTVSTLANYRGSIKNVYAEGEECATHFANGDEAPNGCRIASFTTVDLSMRYRFLKNLEVFGTVQNLFDRVAPFDPTTYGALSFNPLDISGAIGRYYTVGLKYAFK